MDSEDGDLFIKQLAAFVRTHETALANALQFRRQPPRHGNSHSVSSLPTSASLSILPERPSTSASSSTSGSLAAAFSLGSLSLASPRIKATKLALTSHHLFYLLSRFEELGIPVGPMGIRIENIHDVAASTNYVSFLSQSQRSKSHGSDVGSIRSVSSVRSVMSGMSALWANFSLGSSISAARTERQKAALQVDLKYLYSAFTKIPCLRLAPDWRARLIRGYEEFPFDSAVPLYVFKNVQSLEVCDKDFRHFFGWDRLADQLRSLTLKRAVINDPIEFLVDVVLDDMEKRRRRTSKTQSSASIGSFGGRSGHMASIAMSPRRSSPPISHAELHKSMSMPASPDPRVPGLDMRIGSVISNPPVDEHNDSGDGRPPFTRSDSDETTPHLPSKPPRPRSHSPRRPSSSRNGSSYARGSHRIHRSGSESSHSSMSDSWHNRRGSTSNLLTGNVLPASKWRFLKHLSIADNALTSIPAFSLSPLSNTLHSLDLSNNLFAQIPDSLTTLTALRALNLSHCMIESLHSLMHFPLPAITALNLRANRLQSLAGLEKLCSLERLDLRDNQLIDPMELARLTSIPGIREVWVDNNPFTRTHKDYRIIIFNLFRRTPGYSVDIIIDAAGPSYTERKCLVDRAPLPPVVPAVELIPALAVPTVEEIKPSIVYNTPAAMTVVHGERPSTRLVSSESNMNSSRRKKSLKKRTVNLVTNDIRAPSLLSTISTSVPTPPLPPLPFETSLNRSLAFSPPLAAVPEVLAPWSANDSNATSRPLGGTVDSDASSTYSNQQSHLSFPPEKVLDGRENSNSPLIGDFSPAKVRARRPQGAAGSPLTRLDQALPPLPAPSSLVPTPSLPTSTAPVRKPTAVDATASPATLQKEPRDWAVNGQMYKHKIEALRDQVGEGYLSVSSEDKWDPVRHSPQYHDNLYTVAASSPHTNPIGPRPTSVQAIHSGRTLG
ncbi:hypothetical protein SEPCBS119000_003225 [Sporothrix epigloea]|uniref:Leucine rich repeat domain containing protein n=1 Tax=Sporothrix epigloea TaxID=1892477 RepID=A0ABP0DPP1_9PEZI